MDLKSLVEMSRRYGSDENYVLAGGGNTSYKDSNVLYVKSSGTQLSDITPEQFVAMDLQRLRDMAKTENPQNKSDKEREAKALTDMMSARLPGEEHKRPSVEAILHAIFPYTYVLHTHPALINGMTCSKRGEKACWELFGDTAVWIGLTKPGLLLAQVCDKAFDEYTTKTGSYPRMVFLENHGVFAAADSVSEVDGIMEQAVKKISEFVSKAPGQSGIAINDGPEYSTAPELNTNQTEDGTVQARFCSNKLVMSYVLDQTSLKPVIKPFTPDHIVYCRDEPLFLENDTDVSADFKKYFGRKGYLPSIVVIRGLGFFAMGTTATAAERARVLFLDAMKIARYAESFGGANPLTEEFTQFILNWEAETYRKSIS